MIKPHNYTTLLTKLVYFMSAPRGLAEVVWKYMEYMAFKFLSTDSLTNSIS